MIKDNPLEIVPYNITDITKKTNIKQYKKFYQKPILHKLGALIDITNGSEGYKVDFLGETPGPFNP